jgi:hypothetical protein
MSDQEKVKIPLWIRIVNETLDKKLLEKRKDKPSPQEDLSKFFPAKKARSDKHDIKKEG